MLLAFLWILYSYFLWRAHVDPCPPQGLQEQGIEDLIVNVEINNKVTNANLSFLSQSGIWSHYGMWTRKKHYPSPTLTTASRRCHTILLISEFQSPPTVTSTFGTWARGIYTLQSLISFDRKGERGPPTACLQNFDVEFRRENFIRVLGQLFGCYDNCDYDNYDNWSIKYLNSSVATEWGEINEPSS